MSRVILLSVFITATALLIGASGCSDDDSVTSNDESIAAIARVYPADGTTGLSTTARVSVAFTGPVDTSSFMSNFHLSGGSEMH